MSQSTNDSYPTALKVALILRNEKLVAELEQLAASFRAKGNAYMKWSRWAAPNCRTPCP